MPTGEGNSTSWPAWRSNRARKGDAASSSRYSLMNRSYGSIFGKSEPQRRTADGAVSARFRCLPGEGGLPIPHPSRRQPAAYRVIDPVRDREDRVAAGCVVHADRHVRSDSPFLRTVRHEGQVEGGKVER